MTVDSDCALDLFPIHVADVVESMLLKVERSLIELIRVVAVLLDRQCKIIIGLDDFGVILE